MPRLSAVEQRFRLLGTLGQGGTAVVYDAVDLKSGRPVALKFLAGRTDRGAVKRELAQEAAALARIADKSVCAGYGLDECDGLPCLVMERLRGRDLKRYLAGRPLPIGEVLRLAVGMATGLHAIHAAGVVHNDIKPANVFVTAAGVQFLDLGLAATFPSAGPSAKDVPWKDSVYGTANYIAPERILRRPVTPLSDLFSFGAVLYEMITGVKPFAGASTAETVFNVLDERPTPVLRLRPNCPAPLARIVARLLAKRPEHRFRSAAELCHAIRRVAPRARWNPMPRVSAVGATKKEDRRRARGSAASGADTVGWRGARSPDRWPSR